MSITYREQVLSASNRLGLKEIEPALESACVLAKDTDDSFIKVLASMNHPRFSGDSFLESYAARAMTSCSL